MRTFEKLLEFKKYQSVNIKVGAINGTSFFYCGKGRNCRKDLPRIQAKMNSINRGVLAYLKKRLTELNKNKNDAKFKTDFYKSIEKEKSDLKARIKEAEYSLETPLLEREVKEIVKGICPDENPCYIIYLRGIEKASFWTIKEYERKKKQNYDNYL